MKLIRIVLAVAAAIIALVAIAAVVLIWRFDANTYKTHATTWLESRTGRPATIDGNVELRLFPWLAIEAADATLGNPAGFAADPPFATVERFAAGVRLLPLLSRKVELNRVRIDGLRLQFVRGDDGRGNWEDFGELGARAPSAAPSAGDASAGAPLDALNVEGIEIRNAEVIWHEAGAPRYVLRDIEIDSGTIRTGAPVEAALSLSVLDTASARQFDVATAARIELPPLGFVAAEADARTDGRATIIRLGDFSLTLGVFDDARRELLVGRLAADRVEAADDGLFEANALSVEGRLAAAPAAPGGLPFRAASDSAVFDPARGTIALASLGTEVAQVRAAWEISGRNLFDAPELDIIMQATDVAIGRALEGFGVTLPAGLTDEAIGPVNIDAEMFARLAFADRSPGDDAGLVVGPYRVDALRVPALRVAAFGARADSAMTLGRDGRVTAEFAVPAFVPDTALRDALAPHLPDGLDLATLDRVAASGGLDADLSAGTATLRDLKLDLLGAELTATLTAAPTANGSGHALSGALRTSAIDPQRLAALLGAMWPSALSPERLGSVALSATLEHDTDTELTVLAPLTIEAFGLAVDGRAELHLRGGTPRVTGSAQIAPFSPRELMARFEQRPPETSDPAALGRAAVTTRFEASSGRVRLTDAELTLDDSRMTGDFTVEYLAAPAYRFAVDIDRVDVDRYLPPQSGDLPDDAPDDTRTAGDIELPVDALNHLVIDGRVTVGALRLAGLDFERVETGIRIADGRGALEPARASLYGGEFVGGFHVEAADTPGLRLAGQATALRLEPLITALTGDANVSGTGDFDIDVSGRGATVIANVASANGRAEFTMRDGVIEGFNLGHALCRVYNTLRDQPAPPAQPERTAFQLIRGSATVADGVATTNDLLARAAFMDLTGHGSLTMAEQRLDYTLEAALTGSTGIPNCEPLDRLVGESLPLVLRGTVTDPDIRPDFSQIIERLIRNEVRDRIQDRVQDRLRDLLR